MSGDFSRLTFNPAKHFSGVRMQQGRLQIDADWNEQMDILTHRMETEVGDFLGRHGVPISVNNGKGFAISVNANGGLQLGAGRYYIAGRLFENELDSAISGVPVPPSNSFNKPDAISRVRVPQSNSFYVAYLDTWQRHIAAAQDSSIVEVALGGPDTATRIKNEWLVRFEPTTQTDPVALRNGWQPVTVPISTGFMNARLNAQAFSLENQLYRIEIHEITDNGSMRFKWSRDNGSIIAAIVPPVDIEGGVITVTSIGRDDIQSFQANQWIELTTKAQTNQGQPGVFIQIQNINGHQITATQASWAAALTIWKATNIGASDFDLVRRWDMPNGLIEATISDANAQDGWQLIEQGIEVRFQPGTVGKQYKPGDYWLTTSRAAIGSIEWPHDQSGQPVAQPAHGIQHTFVPLALLQSDGKQWSVANDGDLRTTFRPMVDGLVNKSGDTMTGKLRIEDALEVSGTATLNNNVTIGTSGAMATLTVNGAAFLNTVAVSGNTTLTALQVNGTGPTNFVGGLQVGGPANLTHNLIVARTSTLLGDLTVSSTVRIATATTGVGLEINRDITNETALQLTSSGTGWGSGIRFKNTASGAKTYGIYSGIDKAWHFADVDTSTDRLIIDANGNVGIGAITPQYKLGVEGNAFIRGNLTITGTITTKFAKSSIDSTNLAPNSVFIKHLNTFATTATITLGPNEPAKKCSLLRYSVPDANNPPLLLYSVNTTTPNAIFDWTQHMEYNNNQIEYSIICTNKTGIGTIIVVSVYLWTNPIAG